MPTEWFRQEFWGAAVEEAFEKRLRRSRNKEQHLRIQAGHLLKTAPDVSLKLINRTLAMNEPIWRSTGLVVKAEAERRLNRPRESLETLVSAIDHERLNRTVRSGAALIFAKRVALERATAFYGKAEEALTEDSSAGSVFPAERYEWHGARAIIFADTGRRNEAVAEARLALDAASGKASGSWKHPKLGLVGGTVDGFGRRIRAIASPRLSLVSGMLAALGQRGRPLA